ncbi:glycosyltransferase family 2 protein, partial [Spirosoma litoris]
MDQVVSVAVRGNKYLYALLLLTFIYTCLKILHEWVHYFCITVPRTPLTSKVYTVDIFTTFCAGEPYSMIEETLTAIQAITYPHQTYLCDEADDPYLREVCRQLGVHHVTRIDKRDAKAGNINNALKNSSGELCVVLDPDHVPFPNFLDPIVAHFDDPKIGYVQIVQAYKNHDESLIAKGAAQQTYQFYGPMMMTMNAYGTVLAIGANCTFRRAALESIGGHAAGLAEDMHTSMQLHAKGWQSLYVPTILARGLVPSTLSAYYKQQLKWSRGVFELLVSTYPKLFRQFTWQQKLHYAVIPLHYISGFIFLINFIIPIIAVFFGASPIQIDVVEFGLIVLPFVSAVILIRHYAQEWVMEDKERGFHVVGGLLMIGTWWVFITGFVYTLIRKNVPYIPTPKDNQEADNWALNIPNLIVIGLSIAAAVYGLSKDWNPYNLAMAGFAIVNSLILSFTVLASRQMQFERVIDQFAWLSRFMQGIKAIKINFWLVRRRIYSNVRNIALPITFLLACWIGYIAFTKVGGKENPLRASLKLSQFTLGSILADRLASPAFTNNKSPINILPLALGETVENMVTATIADSIYQKGAYPIITWEPWRTKNHQTNAYTVFQHINNGDYDPYLDNFAAQIKALDRPIYICFAPSLGNSSVTLENIQKEYKAAWKYVYSYFIDHGVNNAIWVWIPGNLSALNTYFPGKDYVDWIGLANIKTDTSFIEFYHPFHRHPIFRSGLPVMLIKTDASANGEQPDRSVSTLAPYQIKYPELKSLVVLTQNKKKGQPDLRQILAKPTASAVPKLQMLNQQNYPTVSSSKRIPFSNLFGVTYTKGQDWNKNLTSFSKKELLSDINEMKWWKINTIRRYGPSIYDYNILNAARSANINVQYGYWIPDYLNFRTDQDELESLRNQILTRVNELKDEKVILSWHLGNAVLQNLSRYYVKPELLYQQDAYLDWLKNLILTIKRIDPGRAVTIDVNASETLPETVTMISRIIPQIDSFGLVLENHAKAQTIRLNELSVPYFFSAIEVADYAKFRNKQKSVFFPNWQDEQTTEGVTFNGLKDHWGRNKFSLLQLWHIQKRVPLSDSQPVVKILKPALATVPYTELTYHAIIKKRGKWSLIDSTSSNFRFEWKLVQLDQQRNP